MKDLNFQKPNDQALEPTFISSIFPTHFPTHFYNRSQLIAYWNGDYFKTVLNKIYTIVNTIVNIINRAIQVN